VVSPFGFLAIEELGRAQDEDADDGEAAPVGSARPTTRASTVSRGNSRGQNGCDNGRHELAAAERSVSRYGARARRRAAAIDGRRYPPTVTRSIRAYPASSPSTWAMRHPEGASVQPINAVAVPPTRWARAFEVSITAPRERRGGTTAASGCSDRLLSTVTVTVTVTGHDRGTSEKSW